MKFETFQVCSRSKHLIIYLGLAKAQHCFSKSVSITHYDKLAFAKPSDFSLLHIDLIWRLIVNFYGCRLLLRGVKIFYLVCTIDLLLIQWMLYLMSLSTCNLPFVICGDFNVPNFDWLSISPASSSKAAVVL